jgi:hypothetical protein
MKQIIRTLNLSLICLLLSSCSQGGGLLKPAAEVMTPTAPMVTLPPTAVLPQLSKIDYTIREQLIVWGRSQDSIAAECRLLILDPTNETEPIRSIVGQRDCNYMVAEIREKQYLVSLPRWIPESAEHEYPPEIILYGLASSGELHVYQRITLGNIRLMGIPQWTKDGSAYLAGIADGQEQIFRYDSQTALIETYLNMPDGFVTMPRLSPDENYLAYEVIQDYENNYQCRMACNFVLLRVRDIHTGEDIDLASLAEPWIVGEPYYPHCDLTWSPTSKFVAWNVGASCGLQQLGSVAIVDVKNQEVVEVFNAAHVSKTIWFSNDRLIIGIDVTIATADEFHEGALIYSPANQTWQPLVKIPKMNKYGNELISFSQWFEGEDGLVALGQTQLPDGERNLVQIGLNKPTIMQQELYPDMSSEMA